MIIEHALEYSEMVRRISWSNRLISLCQGELFVMSEDNYTLTQCDNDATDWEVPKMEVWWWPLMTLKPIEIVIRITESGEAILVEEVEGFLVGQKIYFWAKTKEDCFLLPQQVK